jgi:CheY-like chemotaxis protein
MAAREFTVWDAETTHRQRVLLVDAFPDEAALYSEFFRYRGLYVQVYDRTDLALLEAFADPPDIIVARMRQAAGQIDGIEFSARIRLAARTQDIPIVIITTSILSSEHESAKRAGCNSLILLPVTPDELLDEVWSLISSG